MANIKHASPSIFKIVEVFMSILNILVVKSNLTTEINDGLAAVIQFEVSIIKTVYVYTNIVYLKHRSPDLK